MKRLVAELKGPPHRKFSLTFRSGETPEGHGWTFDVYTLDEGGNQIRWQDFWDPTLKLLLPTILNHSAPELLWIDEETNQTVQTLDLHMLDR